jgi:hypothetical protein
MVGEHPEGLWLSCRNKDWQGVLRWSAYERCRLLPGTKTDVRNAFIAVILGASDERLEPACYRRCNAQGVGVEVPDTADAQSAVNLWRSCHTSSIRAVPRTSVVGRASTLPSPAEQQRAHNHPHRATTATRCPCQAWGVGEKKHRVVRACSGGSCRRNRGRHGVFQLKRPINDRGGSGFGRCGEIAGSRGIENLVAAL